MKPELYRVAHHLMSNAGIKPDHHVLVVGDSHSQPLAEIFHAAASTMAKESVLAIMAVRRNHGQEPPPIIAEAMAASDIVVHAVTYALTHTDATRYAKAKGAQIFTMRGLTEELMFRMLRIMRELDRDELLRVTNAVADRLTRAKSIHLTTDLGTDIRMDVTGRKAISLAGQGRPGHLGGSAFPGEAAIAPIEGSAIGKVVFEYSMDNLGVLDQPIHLTVKEGNVTAIEGGRSADELRLLLDQSDACATNIAEFAIGTNPVASLAGNMAENKKVRGAVHMAIGDNMNLDGAVRSDVHLDGMVLRPTVTIDGETVVDRGRLMIEG
ncbi:aminopeptidase [Thermodesulfobacteriota bacterium]